MYSHQFSKKHSKINYNVFIGQLHVQIGVDLLKYSWYWLFRVMKCQYYSLVNKQSDAVLRESETYINMKVRLMLDLKI